ncbi:MAG TPA: sugar ABC transporter ATP-binding protein [Opitutaceae bacterium]|jgi:ribose transport system ATP-binding protein|nr:sugar ABC transporter ATP-binding protein [Opitutaceae bacterium]
MRLSLEGVRKAFGATQALKSVSLVVSEGEVHALIGENGAGKSTLLKILSGAHTADEGRMELDGRPYRPDGPSEARALGVAMIYQEINLAPHLSVRENILLGSESSSLGWIDTAASRKRAAGALAALGYEHFPLERLAGEFTIAEQQVIEIARALLIQPRVLIMDEPTSSLTKADTERLFEIIGRLKRQGVSVIYVSHFLEECRRVCDRYTVLKDGEAVGSGEMKEAGIEKLVAMMTGRPVADLYPRTERKMGSAVLEAKALQREPRLKTATFKVRQGEIFGLAGLIGAGRTDLLRTIFGLDEAQSGSVAVFGNEDVHASPAERWRQGLGFLSENRKEEGLMLNQPIRDNITLTKLRAFGTMGWISHERQAKAAKRWTAELAIKCRNPEQPAGELSGGNQQKVALARLLEHPANILLLDEPTRGIDVGSKAQIYEIIGQLAAAGKTVIVVSSYLPELLGLCDTIGVMRRGELVAVKPRSEWTETDLLGHAVGTT